MKIVLNGEYGGFSVSKEFMDYYNIPYEKICTSSYYPVQKIERTDKRLIEYIEKFGSKAASGSCAKLYIENVENGCLYRIKDHDGLEDLEIIYEDGWKLACEN